MSVCLLKFQSFVFEVPVAISRRSKMTQTGRNVVGWNGPMTGGSFIICAALLQARNLTVTAGSRPEIALLCHRLWCKQGY